MVFLTWRPDLLAGGPPCQPFSSSGSQRSVLDKRGRLFEDFVWLAEELNPRTILFENVRGLVTSRGHGGEPGEALHLVRKAFEEIGYATRFEDEVNFEFVQVAGNEALKEYFRLWESDKKKLPIILGSPEEVRHLQQVRVSGEDHIRETLERTREIFPSDWFEDRFRSDEDYFSPPNGAWPKWTHKGLELTGHLHVLSRKPKKQVVIGLFPVELDLSSFALFVVENQGLEPRRTRRARRH